MVSVCDPLSIFEQWISFHKIWYESYASGGHSNHKILNFLWSVATT